MKKPAGNPKFTEKYGVKLASAYEADPDDIVIPPKGHALYDPDGNREFDEVRVKAIDEAGKFVGVIPIWTDVDKNKLYAIDGRGNVLDCREVNRRRKKDGREPIRVLISRFPGDLDAAVDLVAMRNFRRKRPAIDHTAREIVRYWLLGRAPARIAEILNLESDPDVLERGAEKALRSMATIAYCVPEVVDAIKAGRISIKKAKRFGGNKIDGENALGRDAQLALLDQMTAPPIPKGVNPDKPLARGIRVRVASRLANGAASNLPPMDLTLARGMAAYERYMNGDRTALDYVPAIKAIVDAAVAEKPAEKKPAVPEAETEPGTAE